MSIRLLQGDCRQVLKTLPADSVHCCVTSPPYWGLRSYLPEGHADKHMEIGSEPTVQEWVATMVDVFREVRRVLRPDGTCWVNLGDSYATGAGRVGAHPGGGTDGQRARDCAPSTPLNRMPMAGFKPKDLIGQPWRAAFALQEDGWWLRQEIIWAKKNPMPESIRDRFTKAHEHVFLLTKSERYYFDFDAVQEPASENTHARLSQNVEAQVGSFRAHAGEGRGGRPMKAMAGRPVGTGVGFGYGYDKVQKPRAVGRRQGPPGNPAEGEQDASPKYQGQADEHRTKQGLAASERQFKPRVKDNDSFNEAMAVMPLTRNPRSVRHIASEPFKGAHYATYPPALIEPFILAGCPEGGTVLDPFGGSGTTGLVADRHHRNAILIDLDERNVPMATSRISGDAPLFAEVTA